LAELAQQPDLTPEQRIQVALALYKCSPSKSEEENQAFQILWRQIQRQDISSQERLQIAIVPFTLNKPNYSHQVEVLRLLLSFDQKESVKDLMKEKWEEMFYISTQRARVADIPAIIELATQEILPAAARNNLYRILLNTVPQFASKDVRGEEITESQ
jgi:hypothetical protein